MTRLSNPTAMEDRASSGARLFSPSAARNRGPIAAKLATIFPRNATVLEIGAGTGEHGAALCEIRKDITWQPSDPDPISRSSQDEWAKDFNGRIHPSLKIDVSQPDWQNRVPEFDALYCSNVIHIAPWTVAQGLARGAAARLGQGAFAILYGPFLDGPETAASNLAFDQSLKSRNREWGVRDLQAVTALFSDAGFTLNSRTDMPSNNLMLVFERQTA
jgi:Protein of unknown function (DUF938)